VGCPSLWCGSRTTACYPYPYPYPHPHPYPYPCPCPYPYPYPDQVWQPDDSLLVLRMTSVGGGALMVSPKRKRVRG
jgi:hypothetical protein